jgi:hypothetical protein
MMLAAIRADSVNFPLLIHVLGAMLLVGALAASVAAVVLSRTGNGVALQRIAFRAILAGAIPAFLLMRVGAEWVKDKENVSDDANWVGIGYGVADTGLLLLIVATVLAGLALRRARRGGSPPGALGAIAAVLVSLLLVGYGIAIWAMTSKPD